MANYFQAMGGCDCRELELGRISPAIVRAAERATYQHMQRRRQQLGGLGTPPGKIVALIPRSDPKAVANAIRLFQAAKRGDGLAGFGDAAQVSTAASYAATGAKVGSIIPVVGTVIGAVIGAVVGWLSAKKPPVRPSKEAVEQSKRLLAEYEAAAAQMPSEPIPLDLQQWKDINLALNIIHGGIIGLRDPRYMGIGIDPVYIPVMKQIVQKIFDTQVGASVNLAEISFKDPKGRTVWYKAHAFTNPPFTDIRTLSDGPFTDAEIKHCQDTAGKGAGGCVQYMQLPLVKRWHWDSLAWAARTVLPNISEADLREASTVAQATGTSARDVVAAVESIIQANVSRGQVAHLLNPAANPPPPPVPPPAQSSAPPVPPSSSTELQPSPASPLPSPVPGLPPPGSSAIDVSSAVAYELARQRAADKAAAPAPVQAGIGGNVPLLLGGAALLFALAQPQRGGRRR